MSREKIRPVQLRESDRELFDAIKACLEKEIGASITYGQMTHIMAERLGVKRKRGRKASA